MNLSTPVAYRRTVLDFCLAPLRLKLGEETAGDVPSTLEVKGQRLDIDGWEQSALRETLAFEGDGAKPWAGLVTEGVAFRLGCKLKLSAFANRTCNPESLITFLGAGLALSNELQHMIDLLIVAGQVGSAKKVTQFRNKILLDLKSIRRLLADGDIVRAESTATELTGPQQKSLPVSSSIGVGPKGAGEYKPRQRESTTFFDADLSEARSDEETERSQRRRVLGMSALLFGSTLVWLIFFMPRLFEPKAVVLQKPQFSHLPAVSSVMARPPSLYVEVQPQAWDALDTTGRQALLEEIGKIAIGANYNGAQIKNERTGDVVGRWLRQRGAVVVSGS